MKNKRRSAKEQNKNDIKTKQTKERRNNEKENGTRKKAIKKGTQIRKKKIEMKKHDRIRLNEKEIMENNPKSPKGFGFTHANKAYNKDPSNVNYKQNL